MKPLKPCEHRGGCFLVGLGKCSVCGDCAKRLSGKELRMLDYMSEESRRRYGMDWHLWTREMQALAAQLRLESEFDRANPLPAGADLAKGGAQ